MGEVEAKAGIGTRSDLRHDRHTVSLLTDHLVFSPKYSVSWIAKRLKGRSSKLLRDRFQYLREWCPGHLWAPSCYHGSVGHGWEVVEKYISGQKGYEKGFGGRERREGSGERCGYEETEAMPVVVIVEEKEKALKIGYMTLHAKLFGASQK